MPPGCSAGLCRESTAMERVGICAGIVYFVLMVLGACTKKDS